MLRVQTAQSLALGPTDKTWQANPVVLVGDRLLQRSQEHLSASTLVHQLLRDVHYSRDPMRFEQIVATQRHLMPGDVTKTNRLTTQLMNHDWRHANSNNMLIIAEAPLANATVAQHLFVVHGVLREHILVCLKAVHVTAHQQHTGAERGWRTVLAGWEEDPLP